MDGHVHHLFHTQMLQMPVMSTPVVQLTVHSRNSTIDLCDECHMRVNMYVQKSKLIGCVCMKSIQRILSNKDTTGTTVSCPVQ